MMAKMLPIKFRLDPGKDVPALQWKDFQVPGYYAWLGKLGFHIGRMDHREDGYNLAIYIHTPQLITLYWKPNIPDLDIAKQDASDWLLKHERAQLERLVNDGSVA